MPYSLHLKIENQEEIVLKPIANDNPKSEFNFDDRKIERKMKPIIQKLKKYEDVIDCYIKKY